MKVIGWVFAFVLASACSKEGDSSSASTDDDDDGSNDTFTAFVIDIIDNHTNDTEEPVAFEMFASLPDPDVDNLDAYVALF